jgi:hypothetical protein
MERAGQRDISASISSLKINKYCYSHIFLAMIWRFSMNDVARIDAAADRLAELHGQPFGGKPAGRYRISARLLRGLTKRRRLYEDDIRNLTRAMLERGYVLIDMDSFFVVMSANTFTNYRRANEERVA